MNKSDIPYVTEAFDNYIQVAYDIELIEGLQKAKEEIHSIPFSKLEDLGDKAYAPNKWTVKDLFQHMIDTERIFNYRALRFARMDATALPGFEENDYAAHADAAHRNMKDLLQELITVRETTIQLFTSFTDKMLLAEGTASGRKITSLAIGYAIIGHQLHHYKVIQERYLTM